VKDTIDCRFLSFDGTERVSGSLARPDRYRQLFDVLSRPRPAIPRGAGLSYCCASAGEDVVSVSSRRFDRVLGLDRDAGTVVVEPGVTVGALHDLAVRNGWYPPILPGHPEITVGGCVAFDVHGKSGRTFRSCVLALTLFHPSFGEIECSPEVDAELFELTVGGCGLTGFVTSVTLQLVPVAGSSLVRRRSPVADLSTTLEDLLKYDRDHDFAYSWNDLSARGNSFGRGIVYLESFADETLRASRRTPGRGAGEPAGRLPVPLLGRRIAPIANRIYYEAERRRGRSRLDLGRGSFPILGKEGYFRALGRRGFREYQMLVPIPRFPTVIERLQAAIVDTASRPCLGSLKILDAEARLLRFSGRGVAVAVDVPAGPRSRELFARLDAIALEVGARVNLSKDSRVGQRVVAELFPEYGAFRSGVESIDSGRGFDSALRRRVLG